MTMEQQAQPSRWKQRMLKLLYYLVGFFALVLIMDNLVMPWYTKHGKEYELPDITELPVEQAIDILKQNGFTPVIQDSVYDSDLPPGTVLRQNPLPFSTVKKGRRVYLVVSIGEKPVIMPNLVGLTPQDAKFRLTEEALQLNRTFYDFSEYYPKGVVIAQSVPPGDTLRKGQSVNITVSLGPPPEAQKVPSLKGKSLIAAKKELEVLGIPLGRIDYQYRPDLVPETVVAQSIPAGTPVVEADSINLVVSTDRLPEEETPQSNQEP
ncbi:MAG: PASTA domain-containing protein [Calditrichaeota bacterium]|nr:PASTA domain-containing protein [Calditrichota bacterium]